MGEIRMIRGCYRFDVEGKRNKDIASDKNGRAYTRMTQWMNMNTCVDLFFDDTKDGMWIYESLKYMWKLEEMWYLHGPYVFSERGSLAYDMQCTVTEETGEKGHCDVQYDRFQIWFRTACTDRIRGRWEESSTMKQWMLFGWTCLRRSKLKSLVEFFEKSKFEKQYGR